MSVETAGAPSSPAILLVDDNAATRLAIRTILAPLGHAVIEAESGYAALRAVLDHDFALILMDVRMPNMNGYETAELIRQRSQTRLTPIIFITASVEEYPPGTDAAYASGAVDFIVTPVHPDVLRVKVSTYIDLFARSQELERSLESISVLNAALRDSEARARAVLENVAEGIVTTDEQGRIESLNQSARRLFGYSEEEAIGQPMDLIIGSSHHDDRSDPASSSPSLLTGEDARAQPSEILGRRKDGSLFPIEVETSQMQLGERRLAIDSIRDVSERKGYKDAIAHQALHDALTGLPNRTLLADRISQAIASAERAGQPRGVLVVDLNGYKQINDRLGHERGDILLTEISRRLSTSLRQPDTVARLGGDEFAILLDGPADLTAVAAAVWKIQHACDAGFVIADELVSVSTSIGIAMFPQHGTSATDLLHRADLAMYDAKRSGASHAVFDAAQEKQLAHSLALLTDLRECVARDELVVYYQPLIDLATRRTTGVEALVRWRHPTQGLLQPGSFLPQAEHTALIAPLTRWILNDALRQQQSWYGDGVDLSMAINISARALKPNGDLPATVAELTETWGTAPDRLTLELTESTLIDAAAPAILERLHQMGDKVSIDDFGTGYSSLAHLQNLPVDQIKVDQSFVANLATVPSDAVIVRSTIDLAHNLGMTVVAEGVEDQATLDLLADYGCDIAQGHFFSRALAAADLTAWLTESPFGVHPAGH